MEKNEVVKFLFEHNIKTLDDAWNFYTGIKKDARLRGQAWDAYCFLRDGSNYKPARYHTSTEKLLYNKPDLVLQ